MYKIFGESLYVGMEFIGQIREIGYLPYGLVLIHHDGADIPLCKHAGEVLIISTL